MAQCARIILLSLWRKWATCSLRSGRPTATQIIYDLIFYLTPSSHPCLSHCLLLVHVQYRASRLHCSTVLQNLRHHISLWATADSLLWQNTGETQGNPVSMKVPSKWSDFLVCCFPSSRRARPHPSTKPQMHFAWNKTETHPAPYRHTSILKAQRWISEVLRSGLICDITYLDCKQT